MASQWITPRENLGLVEIIALTLLALLVLHWMLGGGGLTGASGLLRVWWIKKAPPTTAATAAAYHHSHSAAATFVSRPVSQRLYIQSPGRRFRDGTDTMLQRARSNFDNSNASSGGPQKTTRQLDQLFSSSPPPAMQQSQPVLGHASGNSNKPLTTGIKRSHSGLAKAFGNAPSFDDDAPHRENAPVKCAVPKLSNSEFFSEDDFSDDIDLDLDIEELTGTIKYPTLPKVTAAQTAPFRPTAKRQVQDTNTPRDSGYGSQDSKLKKHDSHGSYDVKNDVGIHNTQSSTAIPWSSSPTSHLNPPPQTAAAIRRFAYNNGPAPPRVQPKQEPTAKRRTLPWLSEHKVEQSDVSYNDSSDHKPVMSTKKRVADTTPAKTTSYPWNTTASAIKEQKTSHREAAVKKKLKLNDASEEQIQKAKVKSRKNAVARVFLSEEQQHVLDLIADKKKSVFFTGAAGTGKSVLLREIISTLRKKFLREPDRVAVTASTGLAACNIGGVTLHSFAGIGLGKEDVPELVKKIKRNQKAKHRWMRTKVLVVDEISMVDGDLFDKLEAIARQIRNNGRPFGGIQIVITGDFFQLPPVPDSGKVAKFAFDAATWSTTIEYTIGLHHVFRQKDPLFANMLNEMREGRMSADSIRTFHTLSRPLDDNDGFVATELFPTRSEVENANQSKMSQLVGDVKLFDARDGGSIVDKTQRDRLLANCMAPETIALKKGAQVMLIKNIDESLVNGSLGKVIGFMNEMQFDSYTTNEENFLATQGGTLKEDGERSKQSRARDRLMENLLGSTSQAWPVVRFTLADSTTRDLLCQRETWKVELPDGEVQASRAQVPLILAWALSIHKAQGQTLEKVKVDLGKVFEKGQAYVALSRATNMQGLQVLRFDPRKVVAHEKVRTFYSNLSRVESLEMAQPKAERGKSSTSRANGITGSEYERNFATGRM